ncbi:MAG: nucleoside deaminase [Parasporobacterium sp.]|nr:nucleoside deaminase [Parasporobacterium sp.]
MQPHYKMKKLTDREKFMKEAIRQAVKASAIGEVPIGCVIVYDGRIIGRGYNRRMTDRTALAHAEITAIRKANKVIGDWRLDDCEMYVTLEPCQMCAGAIVQSRIRNVYIGAMNPKAGCAGSILDLLREERFNHQCIVETGLMEERCSELLKEFFVNLRTNQKNKKTEAGT